MQIKESLDAEYCFHEGTGYESHKYFGCFESALLDGKYSYTFRVWAPNAYAVSLVGDRWGWQEGVSMVRGESGIWHLEYISDESLAGAKYKYKIASSGGVHLKGDPYAAYSEGGAGGASVIYRSRFEWSDQAWMKHRFQTVTCRGDKYLPIPLNIYELHVGSFAKNSSGEALGYRELANFLPGYVKSMGFTHIEFMPLAEYPFDDSWGYQICAYFAPTSRYGSPDDLKFLINECHRVGIGVIMDWVPAHFPRDEWGLFEFDGSTLYEYADPNRRTSPSWGTNFFDLGKPEVRSFLISNAVSWIEDYHFDGLRVDAVASMLYLDYDRQGGVWSPNMYGDNRNLEAMEFLRKLNSVVLLRNRDALMIAEESTAWQGVTTSVESGGLGFSLKWNMGWANDFFEYLKLDPIYRKYHHRALTFPLIYAWSENFILPISHDEVVYGKGSLASKIYESGGEKSELLRAVWLFMLTFPGKKMFFMGSELGQLAEWNFRGTPDWYLADSPDGENFVNYVAAANRLYLSTPELWEDDFTPDGFSWVYPDMENENTVVYKRYGLGGSCVVTAVNFSGLSRRILLYDTDEYGYRLAFVSSAYFTGIPERMTPIDDGYGRRVEFDLPARCAVVLKTEKGMNTFLI